MIFLAVMLHSYICYGTYFSFFTFTDAMYMLHLYYRVHTQNSVQRSHCTWTLACNYTCSKYYEMLQLLWDQKLHMKGTHDLIFYDPTSYKSLTLNASVEYEIIL